MEGVLMGLANNCSRCGVDSDFLWTAFGGRLLCGPCADAEGVARGVVSQTIKAACREPERTQLDRIEALLTRIADALEAGK
jgi:hypothetical protein